jgi:hypothetical protein
MRTRIAPRACVLLTAIAVFAAPALSSAQGNGNGNGQGRPKNPKGPTSPATPSTSAPAAPTPSSGSGSTQTPSSTSTPSPLAPAGPIVTEPVIIDSGVEAPLFDQGSQNIGFRQFGAWLDDASAPSAGEGFVSIMAGHWRLAEVTQTNIPMVAAGIGLSDRVQVSASVPFYRVNYQGATSAGLDDVYLSGKVTLVDPALTLSEVGLSVSPVVEILNGGSDRIHFAIPVSVEVRRFPFRAYGSAGYFTRGSFFSAGAVEWTSRGGTSISGSLSQSNALNEDVVLDSLGVSRRRLDVSGSVAHALGRAAIATVSVGRSLSSIAEGGTRLSVMGGVTFRFSALRATR